MTRMRLITLSIIAVLVLSACGEGGFIGATVITDGDHLFGEGERVRGELVILDGDVRLERNSHVSGSVHVLGGVLTINGGIEGDVTVLNGDVTLQPYSSVTGDVVHSGGTLARADGASVGGDVVETVVTEMPLSPGWTDRSLSHRLRTLLITTLVPMTIAYLGLRARPRPIMRISDAITSQPLVSGSLGLLTLVVWLVLTVFMVFTVVLIPVAVIGMLLLGLTALLGWVSMGYAVGHRLAEWRRWQLQPYAAGLIGNGMLAILAHMLELVPLIGPLVPIGAIVVGFGAVLLTRFGHRRFVPHTWQDAPDDISMAT